MKVALESVGSIASRDEFEKFAGLFSAVVFDVGKAPDFFKKYAAEIAIGKNIVGKLRRSEPGYEASSKEMTNLVMEQAADMMKVETISEFWDRFVEVLARP